MYSTVPVGGPVLVGFRRAAKDYLLQSTFPPFAWEAKEVTNLKCKFP